MFSSEFCEISKNVFLTEHLWATASELKYRGAVVEGCSEPCKTTKMERFAKIVKSEKPLIIFAKRSTLDICQVSEYVSALRPVLNFEKIFPKKLLGLREKQKLKEV